jgi:enoyl-CoA hydratase/carnithine racemase
MIDMLHMGYVDEVVCGREVLTRLPALAKEWKAAYDDALET